MSRFSLFLTLLLCLCLSGCNNNSAPNTETANKATPAATAAPLPDAGAMIERMITQGGCKDFTAEMRMTAAPTVEDNGKRDQIEFRIQRKYNANGAATFLTVLSPKEETEKAILAIENRDGPTQALSYLAGLKKLTRLNSDRQLSFRGAKVTVQELLGMELGAYDHNAGERVTADGASLIKIEFKAKPDRNLAFPRIIGFFHEKDQTPARFEFYDSRDELQKRLAVEEVKIIQNHQAITRVAIEDLAQKLKLSLETRKIEFDRGLSDNLFTEDRLKSVITSAGQKLI